MQPPQAEGEQPEVQPVLPAPVPMDIDIIPVRTPNPEEPDFLMFHFVTQIGSNFYFINVDAVENIFLPDVKAALEQVKGSGIIVPPGIAVAEAQIPNNGSNLRSDE